MMIVFGLSQPFLLNKLPRKLNSCWHSVVQTYIQLSKIGIDSLFLFHYCKCIGFAFIHAKGELKCLIIFWKFCMHSTFSVRVKFSYLLNLINWFWCLLTCLKSKKNLDGILKINPIPLLLTTALLNLCFSSQIFVFFFKQITPFPVCSTALLPQLFNVFS